MINTLTELADIFIYTFSRPRIELFILVTTAFLPLILHFLSSKPALKNNKIFIDIIRAFPMLWILIVGVEICIIFRDFAGISNENLKYWLHIFSSSSVFSLVIAFLPTKIRWSSAGAMGIVLISLIYCDLIYYRYFANVMPLSAFSSKGQLWDARNSIQHLLKIEDIGFLFLALGSFSLLLLKPLDLHPSEGIAPAITDKQWRVRLVLAIATLYSIWNINLWMGTKYSWQVFDPKYTLRSVGPLHAHFRDIIGTIREQINLAGITETDINDIKEFLSQRNLKQNPNAYTGLASDSNVIFLQIEALQKWVIGSHIDNIEITPFLNKLAKQSLYFSEIFDQTGESSTANCEFATLNSNLPLATGAVAFRRPNNNFLTLAHVLKSQGYSTYAAHAYKRSFWNRAVIFPRFGFDKMAFSREMGTEPKIGWGLADENFLMLQARALGKLPQPFFAFLITLSSHHPYDDIPAHLRQLKTAALTDTELGNYLHSMRYVDQALEKFFHQMKQQNLLKNTVVVLYGDHDAKLNIDKKVIAKASTLLSLNKEQLEQIAKHRFIADQVPLIVKLPGAYPPVEITVPGGQIDIAPTVLNLLAVDSPKSFLGQALFPGQQGFVTNLNGYTADNDYLYDAEQKDEPCINRKNLKPLTVERCNDLRNRAKKTLIISRKITLHNLSRKLSEI